MTRRGIRRDDGSAVVGFSLVAPLVLAVAIAVLQIALTMHVRTVLVSAAAEGARAQARAGSGMAVDPGAGVQRARAIAERSLAAGLVDGITARRERVGGIVLATVEIRARMPLLGLLAPMELTVQGHALEEPA